VLPLELQGNLIEGSGWMRCQQRQAGGHD